MIDKGLVAVAQNDYEDAYTQFQNAHELDKDNILVRKKILCKNLVANVLILDPQQYGCLFPLHWKNARSDSTL